MRIVANDCEPLRMVAIAREWLFAVLSSGSQGFATVRNDSPLINNLNLRIKIVQNLNKRKSLSEIFYLIIK
jgi:hypothetical protein